MPTLTHNYKWQKPDVGASKDTWGALLNAGLDAIDNQVFLVSNLFASAILSLNKTGSGKSSAVQGQNAGKNRWSLVLGDTTAELGGNSGSNLEISRYSDTGALIDSPLSINRATGGLSVTQQPKAANDVATKTYADSAGVPVGSVVDFAGKVPPAGWLLCDGTIYTIAAYPTLGALIKGIYGGNGTTTFAVPSLGGKTSIGVGSGFGLAAAGGEATHLLTTNEMPAHNHPVAQTPHTHTATQAAHAHGGVIVPGSTYSLGVAPPSTDGGSTDFQQPAITVAAANANITLSPQGGGLAHNNMPPYVAMNKIIRAG